MRKLHVLIGSGPDRHEFLGMTDRHRPEHERVQDGEDRGDGRQADGQRQHRRTGKHRRPPQRAQRMMDVPPRVIEPAQPTAIAIGLFHLLHSTEITSRGEARLLRRQPAPFVLGRQQLEVRAHLVVEIGVNSLPTGNRRKDSS